MKRKNLLKVGLLAAGLLVGSNVWADDFTSKVYSEDFSGVSATGVTYSMTGTNNTVTMENGYLDFAVAARAGGTATATFTDSYFSNLAEYKFVCDLSFGYSNSASTSCSLTLNSDNAEGKMFTISYPGFGTATITAADGTTELATNIPTGRYALGTWVTFTLTVTTADGAHLTVSDGTTTYVNNVKIASAGHVTSISGSMGKSYSHFESTIWNFTNRPRQLPCLSLFLQSVVFRVQSAM